MSTEIHVVVKYIKYSVWAESVEEKFIPNQWGQLQLFLLISMNTHTQKN